MAGPVAITAGGVCTARGPEVPIREMAEKWKVSRPDWIVKVAFSLQKSIAHEQRRITGGIGE